MNLLSRMDICFNGHVWIVTKTNNVKNDHNLILWYATCVGHLICPNNSYTYLLAKLTKHDYVGRGGEWTQMFNFTTYLRSRWRSQPLFVSIVWPKLSVSIFAWQECSSLSITCSMCTWFVFILVNTILVDNGAMKKFVQEEVHHFSKANVFAMEKKWMFGIILGHEGRIVKKFEVKCNANFMSRFPTRTCLNVGNQVAIFKFQYAQNGSIDIGAKIHQQGGLHPQQLISKLGATICLSFQDE